MADNKFIALTTDEIACYNDENDKTVLQVKASSTIGLKVLGWSISFDGINVTSQPVEVKIVRQTSAGTMIPIAVNKLNDTVEVIQATAYYDATSEPSSADILDYFQVHPQSGVDIKYPEEEVITIPPDGRIGVIVNASEAVNCAVKIICEE